MSKFVKLAAFFSLTLFGNFAMAEDDSKLPIFVHYTHNNDVEAHLNLNCELGKTSSFSAPYLEQDNPKNAPKWEVFVRPIALLDGIVDIQVTVFEHGKKVMAPRVTTALGEPVSVSATDSEHNKMTLEIKTQRSEGLAPVTSWKYKPKHISIPDAITYTSSMTYQMAKIDLRTSVSYGNEIEFVGTKEFLQSIRERLLVVDVE
jgi:hypothetical protein